MKMIKIFKLMCFAIFVSIILFYFNTFNHNNIIEPLTEDTNEDNAIKNIASFYNGSPMTVKNLTIKNDAMVNELEANKINSVGQPLSIGKTDKAECGNCNALSYDIIKKTLIFNKDGNFTGGIIINKPTTVTNKLSSKNISTEKATSTPPKFTDKPKNVCYTVQGNRDNGTAKCKKESDYITNITSLDNKFGKSVQLTCCENPFTY